MHLAHVGAVWMFAGRAHGDALIRLGVRVLCVVERLCFSSCVFLFFSSNLSYTSGANTGSTAVWCINIYVVPMVLEVMK